MIDKISIVICNDYKLELKSVLEQDGFENFSTFYSNTCQQEPSHCGYSEKFINNLLQKHQITYLIGGSCVSMTSKKYQECGGSDMYKLNQCHYLLASEAIVDRLQNQGAYLVSPGWLNSWKKRIALWGFDRPTAQQFFDETTSKIVLLDTGVGHNVEKNLKYFADYLNLPSETLFVGLDHLKMVLKMIEYKFLLERMELEGEKDRQNNEAANYAMALDIVGQLSDSKSVGETTQRIIDMFTMLFSPQKIIFYSKLECNQTGLEQFQFEGVVGLSNNRQGILIKINIDEEIYGCFEIINVAHPEYLDGYRNLILNLIGVVSLAFKETIYKDKLLRTTKELEYQKRQLELLASTDSLTGLLNRRSFEERIKGEIIRQRRNKKSFSIVICDIDRFKNLNDTHGHPFGDSVLIKFAETLRNQTRDQDSVGRWGGEEFILLLPETDLKGAFILSEKLRKDLEALIYPNRGQEIKVTATFGVSECSPDEDYQDSIKKADQALYEGKRAGRNCVIQAGSKSSA